MAMGTPKNRLHSVVHQIARQIGHDKIWRPLFDGEGNLLVDGVGHEEDGLVPYVDRLDFRGKTVVDMGCNLGTYSFLAARMGAKQVVGIDRDEELIAACKKLCELYEIDNASFIAADFTRVPSNDPFDIALMIDIIGKGFIRAGRTENLLKAAKAYAGCEVLFTLRPTYPLHKLYDSEADCYASGFPRHYLRDGFLHLLEYAGDYFGEQWQVEIISDEKDLNDQSLFSLTLTIAIRKIHCE